MEFIEEAINNYAVQHTTAESEVLKDLNRETHAKVLQARMLSGHLQGRTLSMFSKMIRPSRILEIGTYTAYSAICMAEGLTEEGRLHSIDINEELHEFCQQYIAKAGMESQIQLHIGDALSIIPELKEDWDLVFIDADKENYSNYYCLLIDSLKSGAFIIADNVLWSGKVVENTEQFDQETAALAEFSRMVQEDSRVENVLLPIRDGLMVVRKK